MADYDFAPLYNSPKHIKVEREKYAGQKLHKREKEVFLFVVTCEVCNTTEKTAYAISANEECKKHLGCVPKTKEEEDFDAWIATLRPLKP